MTIDQVISKLYESKDLDACIQKFIPEGYRLDFKHDLIIYLYENYASRIVELELKGQLSYYIARIVINEAGNKGHSNWFKRKYNLGFTVEIGDLEAAEDDDIEQRQDREAWEDKVFEEIDRMDEEFGTFFYRQLIVAIQKHKSMRGASRETGIPVMTISRAVKKVRERINQRINEGDPASVLRRLDMGVRGEDTGAGPRSE